MSICIYIYTHIYIHINKLPYQNQVNLEMNPLTFIFKNSSFDAMLVQLNVINMADTERFVCVISVDSVTTP